MRREEFLQQLEQLLMDISEEERKEALRFYESYFEDAGEANEEKILKELESPQKVADTIKKELGGNSGFGVKPEAEPETHTLTHTDNGAENEECAGKENNIFQEEKPARGKRKQENYVSFHTTKYGGRNESYDGSGDYSGTDGYDGSGGYSGKDGYDGSNGYTDFGNAPFHSYEDTAYEGDDYVEEKKTQGTPIWVKVLIITAICVAGILVVLFIAAIVFGFGIAKNVTNKVLDNVTDKVIDSATEYVDDADEFFRDFDDSEERAADTVYGEYEEGAAVIDIDMKGGKLVLEHSGLNKITYDIDGIEGDLEVKLDDNKLVLVDHRTREKAVKEKGTVVIGLPDVPFETIKIRNDAAIICSEDTLQAKTIEILAGAGDLSLENITAEELMSVTMGAGNGTIEDAVAGKLVLDCGTGAIDYEGAINGDAEISCGVGIVQMEVKGSENTFNYVMNCGIGSIESDYWSCTNLADERKVDNNANKTMKLDCGIGLIELEYDDDDDDYNGSNMNNNSNTNSTDSNTNTDGNAGNTGNLNSTGNTNSNGNTGNGYGGHHPETNHHSGNHW